MEKGVHTEVITLKCMYITKDEGKVSKKLELYHTTQKLKTIRDLNGDEDNYYATTIFTIASDEELDNLKSKNDQKKEENQTNQDGLLGFNILSLANWFLGLFESEKAYAASKSGDLWDSTDGVHAYATIYWNERTYNGILQYRLTQATGGWTVYDSSYALSGRKVVLGESGLQCSSCSVTYYPSSNSFSYTSPSSWPYIEKGNAAVIGVNTYVTISSRSSSWSLHLAVNEYGGW